MGNDKKAVPMTINRGRNLASFDEYGTPIPEYVEISEGGLMSGPQSLTTATDNIISTND
jgi:hypothetical protein